MVGSLNRVAGNLRNGLGDHHSLHLARRLQLIFDLGLLLVISHCVADKGVGEGQEKHCVKYFSSVDAGAGELDPREIEPWAYLPMREANALKGFDSEDSGNVMEEADDGYQFDVGVELASDPLVHEHEDVHSGDDSNGCENSVGPLHGGSRVCPEERQDAIKDGGAKV